MPNQWTVKRLSLAMQTGIAITFAMFAAQVHAAIVECTKPSSSGYAVLLDEPVASTAAFTDHAALLIFLAKLQFTLDQNLDSADTQLPNADVHFVECVKRVPALDGSDFENPSFIETLYNQSTVLEIWGSLDASSHGNTRIATAQINYMLIPIQFATLRREAELSGMLRLEYPASGATPTGDFVKLLARPQDIQALIAASLGYKALRERRFESAHQSLCQASVLLEKMAARLTAPRQLHEASALHDFVVLSAGAAITSAVAVPGYRGTLKVQNPSAPCPVAGGHP